MNTFMNAHTTTSKRNLQSAKTMWSGFSQLERKISRVSVLKTAKSDFTELIGEISATNWMTAKAPTYFLVEGFEKGPGIDQIWANWVGNNLSLAVVEAKGPGAGLGGADQYGAQMSYGWIEHTLYFGTGIALNKRSLASLNTWEGQGANRIPYRSELLRGLHGLSHSIYNTPITIHSLLITATASGGRPTRARTLSPTGAKGASINGL